VVGLTGMLIMAFFCYWFIPAEGRDEQFESQLVGINFLQYLIEYRWVLIGIGAAIVIIIAVFMANVKGRSVMRHYFQLIRQRGAAVLTKVRNAIRIYFNKKLALVGALLLTFCCQGVFIMALVLIGSSLGITVHIKYYFIFFPISWLLGALPISVGGAGVMEWWLKVMFIQVCAVSSEHALVLALCQRLIWLFGSLPGVMIHLIGAHLPKDFFIDYNKSIN